MSDTLIKPLDMPEPATKPAEIAETPVKSPGTAEAPVESPKASVTPVKSLDLKGLLCPMPIIKVSRAIKEINIGETLEAFASDPGVMADMPAWCRSTGNELVSLEKQDKQFHFIVRRSK